MRTTSAAALVLTAAGLVLLPAPSAAAGGGCHAPGVTDDATTEVSLTGACFTPTVARVDAGASITFRNADQMGHMVTGAGQSFGDMTEIGPGESVTHRFAEPGVFPYFCILHPSMVGAVVVGDAPAAAATGGSDGGGNLAGVAAGAGAVATLAGLAAARRRWPRSIVPSPGA